MRGDMVIAGVFLFIVCIGVPYLAFKTKRQLGDGPLPMPKRRFFLQTIGVQLYLFFLAVAAIWPDWRSLFALPPSPLRAWGLAAVFLAALLGVMGWRWPKRDLESKRRLYSLLPHERRDLPVYFLVCIAAGVFEESVYRGAATWLLMRYTSLVPAVLIASVAFALAHVVQGWRSAAVIFVIALGAHALAIVGDSLVPVMAAHALYDALAGVLMPRWFERDVRSAAQSVLSQATLIR